MGIWYPDREERLSQRWQASEQGCDPAESIPMAQNIHLARRQVGVNNVLGLHLRVAGRFVKLANAFQSGVRVYHQGIMADGRSIPSLLSLAAECGTMLALEAEGCDAEDAVAALADLISAPSHDSDDQNGEAQNRGPKSRPMQHRRRKVLRRNRRRARRAITPRNAVPGGIRGGGGPRLDRRSIVVRQSEGDGIGEEAMVEVDRPRDPAFMTMESGGTRRRLVQDHGERAIKEGARTPRSTSRQRRRSRRPRATWGSLASEDGPASGRQDAGHAEGRPVRR